jgi:TatA/E family protein of Tat protein translocase
MFDLGMQELIVIFIVALLVFGPKRLPELGRTLGKGIAELKKAMFDVKKEVYKEMYPPIEEGKEALYRAGLDAGKPEEAGQPPEAAGTPEEAGQPPEAAGTPEEASPSGSAGEEAWQESTGQGGGEKAADEERKSEAGG